MKSWVGLVGWPVADGLHTTVVTHQLQVERGAGKLRRPATDVLPLWKEGVCEVKHENNQIHLGENCKTAEISFGKRVPAGDRASEWGPCSPSFPY